VENAEDRLTDVLRRKPILIERAGDAELGAARGVLRLVGAQWEDHHRQPTSDHLAECAGATVEQNQRAARQQRPARQEALQRRPRDEWLTDAEEQRRRAPGLEQ
jgi:hypothetical protein